MRKIVFILCMALMTVCSPLPASAGNSETVKTSRTTKKKSATRKKAAPRVLATFKMDGNTFQLLSGGKIKCLTDPNWYGDYEKGKGPMGFSRYSPEAEWYLIDLLYRGGDGEFYYLIFDDPGEPADQNKIYEVAAGSVGFTIEVDPINIQVTVSSDDDPDQKYTTDIDQLKVAGTVSWIKK